jgi:hypothetical protein
MFSGRADEWLEVSRSWNADLGCLLSCCWGQNARRKIDGIDTWMTHNSFPEAAQQSQNPLGPQMESRTDFCRVV